MIRFILKACLIILVSIPASHGSYLFFEDFKDGGINFGPGYMTGGIDGVDVTVTTGTELFEIYSANGHSDGTSSWGVEYPRVGSLTWDTAQHRYLQAWIPWKAGNDLIAMEFQVDGSGWTGSWWDTRIDNAEVWYHSQPTLVDVNALAQLTPGVHQLRIRFIVWSNVFDTEGWVELLGMSIDWIKGGMSPAADVTIAKYKDGQVATSVVCGFVGPDDAEITSNPPTMQWSAPPGYDNLKYSVTYSQDPWFRGPTTVSVHNIATTSYTPPQALDEGQWYWTVIPINSDDIAGQDLVRSIASGGYWNTAPSYEYYSFITIGPNSIDKWLIY